MLVPTAIRGTRRRRRTASNRQRVRSRLARDTGGQVRVAPALVHGRFRNLK